MRAAPRALLAAALIVTLTGCAGPAGARYSWGPYGHAVFLQAVEPEGVDAGAVIGEFEEFLAELEPDDDPPGPGLRIHLARLHAGQGDFERARTLLMEERRAFPESAAFVDRLLESLR